MRIAILHGSNDLYGASRVLVQDVTVLRELGARCSVVLPEKGPLTEQLFAAGAEVAIEDLSVLRKVASPVEMLPPCPWHLPAAVREADLVVVWTLALSLYLPALRALRKPVVTSVHEILESRSGAILMRGVGALSSGIMVNSLTTQAWVRRHVAARPIPVAYPVAPTYGPVTPPPQGSQYVALLAGRVNGHKGHLEAVAAVARARSEGYPWELVLLGGSYPGQEGHLHALLEEIEDKPWADYRGEVPDVRPFLDEANVMLVPTTRPEPFGVVALEAWAAGRRVIASDDGGLAEATRMVEGIPVPPRSVSSLADALVRVASNPDLREPPSAGAEVSSLCTMEARRSAWSSQLAALGMGLGIRSEVVGQPT